MSIFQEVRAASPYQIPDRVLRPSLRLQALHLDSSIEDEAMTEGERPYPIGPELHDIGLAVWVRTKRRVRNTAAQVSEIFHNEEVGDRSIR